jgi:CHAT domain-containing protein/tetratricopeptide (TPR) repeat protein
MKSGDTYLRTNDYSRAETLYQRALKILEETLGLEHTETSKAMLGLANAYLATGEYERAESLYQRALVILKRISPESLDTARVLSNLGSTYRNMGAYARAEPFYRRALAINEKIQGPKHPDIGLRLANLAILSNDTGNFIEAEILFKRALTIHEEALGSEHPNTVRTLSYLASVYSTTSAYRQAELLFRRAIAIQQRMAGAGKVDLALTLFNLANMYLEIGRYEQAESLCRQALEMAQESLGAAHPFVAKSIQKLGNLYREVGSYTKAKPLLEQAVTSLEAGLGAEHKDTAEAISDLARLYTDGGEPLAAQPLHRRAIAIYQKSLDADHPFIGGEMRALARAHWAHGEQQQALSMFQRVQQIEARNAERFLLAGSEARNQDYIRARFEKAFGDVSFGIAMGTGASTTLGLTSVLQYKGRVLDAVLDNVARIHRSVAPADQALLDQLADVAGQLSSLTYGSSGNLSPEQYQGRFTKLTKQQEQLQADLASRSRTFKREVTPLTLANIQPAIPVDAVLVELFRYAPFDPTRSSKSRRGPPRYVAYALKHSGEPVAIDIGEAQAIEELARRLRVALANPASSDVKQHSAALSAKLLAPLRVHLRGFKQLLFSPDGELNLVPMAALVDESGGYLGERFDVSYLTSGRDLLRIDTEPSASADAVVVGDPDYGRRAAVTPGDKPSIQPQRSADLDRGGLLFRPLAGTALEARDLKALLQLEDANLLLRRDASEGNLKRLKAPRILHIASHGFFLSDQQLTSEINRRRGSGSSPLPSIENPLLRSGIALAGANERSSGEDDGILTALEATQLDLSGTELVVLSACDTGVGEVQNGEGVYGLRRALALAGAQTQITSLWKVPDEATRALMVDYYRRLLQGEGRSSALRSTQRAMLANPAFSHPYYWASFIPIGNWNPLPSHPGGPPSR